MFQSTKPNLNQYQTISSGSANVTAEEGGNNIIENIAKILLQYFNLHRKEDARRIAEIRELLALTVMQKCKEEIELKETTNVESETERGDYDKDDEQLELIQVDHMRTTNSVPYSICIPPPIQNCDHRMTESEEDSGDDLIRSSPLEFYGIRINVIRKKKGISMSDLADSTGINMRTLKLIELGYIDLESVLEHAPALEDGLSLPTGYLYNVMMELLQEQVGRVCEAIPVGCS